MKDLPIADGAYLRVNGSLLAETVLTETWTDASGRKHVSGESILYVNRMPEFDFETFRTNRTVLVVDVFRGNGERFQFDGVVSRTGMRMRVNEPLVQTYQIDERSMGA